MAAIAGSPYAAALAGRLAELHPALQRYFAAIPEGHVGIGDGVFDVVGTPRRWLWPFLRLVQGRGVVFAGWEHGVPFRVVNRTEDGRALARREFLLPGGAWTMADSVSPAAGGGVVDTLGVPPTVAAVFDVSVRGGALLLESRAIGVRWGRLRVRLPRFAAPLVRLRESYDAASERQRVEVTIEAPVIGRVYEYRGTFTYRVEPA
jgi:hypothetical protein